MGDEMSEEIGDLYSFSTLSDWGYLSAWKEDVPILLTWKRSW